MDINVVTVSGRLTRDAEIKQIGKGSLIKLSIANNRRILKEKEWTNIAYFFDCVYFVKNAEYYKSTLKQGNTVAVSGHIRNEIWESPDHEKRTTTTIMVDNIQLLAASNKENARPTRMENVYHEEKPAQTVQPRVTKTINESNEIIEFEEDIPF